MIKSSKYACLLLFGIATMLTFCKIEKKNEHEDPPLNIENLELEKADTTSRNSNFLFLSDIHLNSQSDNITVYGMDTQLPLWNSAKKKISSIVSGADRPAFMVYTGDLPDHHPSTGHEHEQNITKVLNDLDSLADGMPLFFAPGNNDAIGGDYHSFSDSQMQNPFSLLKTNVGYPAPHADSIYSYNSVYGYYSARPFKGLRIIAMNTVLLGNTYTNDHCQPKKDYVQECQIDEGDNQINWLRDQLSDAENAKEKAYIIMHIPPGKDVYSGYDTWAKSYWLDSFVDYTERFHMTISGFLYGHTHMDELRRVMYTDTITKQSHYTEIGISCPGITPNHSNNSGFKTVSYDNQYEMMDFKTYFSQPTLFSWPDSMYTFSDAYKSGGQPMTPFLNALSLDEVYHRMKKVYYVKNKPGTHRIKGGIDIE